MTRKQDSEASLLDGLVANIRQSFADDNAILSFEEYFNIVVENPRLHLRTAAQFVVDMFDHYGSETIERPTGTTTRYKVFDAPFAGGEGRVAGQEAVQDILYRSFSNFAREGKINKLILMHGPNGSAKSSLARCIMAGMEAYARGTEGAVYSFNWIFPSSKIDGQGIGFGSDLKAHRSTSSYAYTIPDNIDARVPCGMHDHPIFLIPREHRLDLLKKLFPNGDVVHEDGTSPLPGYLRDGDLCQKCRYIYDALLASYDGDVEQVLNHIQVERYYLSQRYRRGAATVEPQVAVDARMQQVTADSSLASLPKALQHVSLFEPSGPLVDANRGLLEFSDLLKRPVEAFKYLLSTVETATVSLDSFVLHLDMLLLASTNETYLDAFKEHPDFPSFKGRMELVKVPYLLDYGEEMRIYERLITERIVGCHVAPHAIDVAALWAVLTRMRRCDHTLYPKELGDVIQALTPLEKLRLYDDGEVPERLSAREAKELLHLLGDLRKESLSYPNYEGRFGASAREVSMAMLNAAHHEEYKCLTPMAVFDELRVILSSKGVYDFLKQEVVKGYHDHTAFLDEAEEIYAGWIDNEVRESMGLVHEGRYLDLFSDYISHISHWVKNERLLDPVTGKYVDPDPKLMESVEQVLLGKGEKAEDFRKSVIGTIGARSLDSPDDMPDFGKIFKAYIERLRDDFFTKRRDVLRKNHENFLKLATDDYSGLDPTEVEQAKKMLARLEKQYGYCASCARDTVAYLLKKRYADDASDSI